METLELRGNMKVIKIVKSPASFNVVCFEEDGGAVMECQSCHKNNPVKDQPNYHTCKWCGNEGPVAY